MQTINGLQIQTEERQGVPWVVLGGDLDLCSAPVLREWLRAYLGGRQTLAVDLSGLAFLDSSGVGVLVGAAHLLGRRRLAVRLRINTRQRRLFGMMGLGKVFLLEDADFLEA